MADIVITKLNEAVVHLQFSSQGVARELSDHFTFDAPNARFHPSYRSRHWDGKIRLYQARNSTIIAGLVPDIKKFAADRAYTVEDNTDIDLTTAFSLKEAEEFIKTLRLPSKLELRDYQVRALALAVRYKRAVLVSPTASGKSLTAYMLTKYFGVKTLIIVPTTSLVHQMKTDFEEYGYDQAIHGVMAGKQKDTDLDVTVSTWQSVYEQPPEFFKDFGLVIGDEAHGFKAKSLTAIMTKMVNTPYRFGMTGTLDGAEVHDLVLKGLFGPIQKVVATSDLIASGTLADLRIKILILHHEKELYKKLGGTDYEDEIKYLCDCDERNRFIRNLALSLTGNTLILYSRVDKHGKILYDMIKDKKDDPSEVYFVSGEVEAEERELIRQIVEASDNATVVASYGTFSTGVNIKRIHNIIFASPSKSRIRVLQSIGRGLRKGNQKEECIIYDISDKIGAAKDKNNFTLNHMIERVKIYVSEGFVYKLYNIDLKSKSSSKLF